MRTSPPFTVFLVLASIVLAGCSSKEADDTGDGPQPSGFPDLYGTIMGAVVDEELKPIPLAQVAVASGIVESTRTDDAGRFLLQGLPPGPDTLYVAAIGYEAAARKIDVMAGETKEVTVTLSQVVTTEPFSIAETRNGLIACGSGAGLNGSGLTQVGCGATDPNQAFLFNYTFGKGLEGILFEMTWTPNQALSRDLVLIVEKNGCGVECGEDDTFAQLQGCCYLRVPVTIDELVKPDGSLPATDFREEGGIIQTRTFPAFGENGSPLTVFTQQQFEIRAEFFYRELPGDWSTRSNVVD